MIDLQIILMFLYVVLSLICLYAIYTGYWTYRHILEFNKIKYEDIIVSPENIKIQPYVLRSSARYYTYNKIELPTCRRALLDIIKLRKSKFVSNDEINIEFPITLAGVKFGTINILIPLRISKLKRCNSDSITTEIMSDKTLKCGRHLLTLRYMSNVFYNPENRMRILIAISYTFIEPETES